jgi:hypothetical protein
MGGEAETPLLLRSQGADMNHYSLEYIRHRLKPRLSYPYRNKDKISPIHVIQYPYYPGSHLFKVQSSLKPRRVFYHFVKEVRE